MENIDILEPLDQESLLKNIILDKSTIVWLKQNCSDKVKKLEPKSLPGFTTPLQKHKIGKISESYESQTALPPVSLTRYRTTPYFEIMDGRHRVAMAICKGKDKINSVIV
jgi:hypothetical protein